MDIGRRPLLLVRTGVAGGSATTRVTGSELTAALNAEHSAFSNAVISDGRRQIVLVGAGRLTGDDAPAYARTIGSDGRLNVRISSRARSITLVERAIILLPVLMWGIAALVSWWLLNRLLIGPLRRLQRGVTAYEPGDDPQTLANQDFGDATEICDLRDAFVRAVARIEETERGMADALEGQRRLVREVHHRVKNNLQVVASLLSIHGRTADSREGKAAFSAIGRRVDALSVVHRNHYAELEENQGIALRALLTELSQGLRASAVDAQRSSRSNHSTCLSTQDFASRSPPDHRIVESAMLQGSTNVQIVLRRTSA